MECIFWGNGIWGMDVVCVSLLYTKHFIGLSSFVLTILDILCLVCILSGAILGFDSRILKYFVGEHNYSI